MEKLAQKHDVPFLGGIPFDPRISISTDAGTLFMKQYPDVKAAQRITEIARRVKEFLLR